jgi:ankyrin repeat protein
MTGKESGGPMKQYLRRYSVLFFLLLLGACQTQGDLHEKSLVTPSADPAVLREIGLALPGIVMEQNGSSHDSLSIIPDDLPAAKEKASYILSQFWGVNTKEEVLSQIAWLKEKGHTAKYRYLQILSDQHPGDAIELVYKNGTIDDGQLNRIHLIRKYQESFGTQGLLGWDLARVVALARWGYDSGYLTEEEAWEYIEDTAKSLISVFSSWEEFGANYVLGRIFWAAYSGNEDKYLYESTLYYWNLIDNGPWGRISWSGGKSPSTRDVPSFLKVFLPLHDFHKAIKNDDLSVVKKILSTHNDLDRIDTGGRSPVFLSVLYSSPAILKELLSQGFSVNCTLNNGATPLYFAAVDEKVDQVKLLLLHGADPNTVTQKGSNPFLKAISSGNSEIVELFLRENPDVNPENVYSPPLLIAIDYCDENTAICLLEMGSDPRVECSEGITALHDAIRKNYFSLMEKLIDSGAELNAQDTNGDTPAHYAVLYESSEMLKTLYESGADITICNHKEVSPLYYAIGCEDDDIRREMVALYIENLDRLQIVSENGTSVLFFLIELGYNDLALRFLSWTGDPEPPKNGEYTALYWAVKHGNLDLVKRLISMGADVNVSKDNGLTALQAACYDPENSPIVQELLSAGADPDIDYNGWTPLLFAALRENDAALRLLVEAGVDVNVFSAESYTALHYVILKQHFDAAEFLIQNGADLTIRNNNGYTAFDYFVMKKPYPDNFLDFLLPLFLEKEVDIFSKTPKGYSPHHFIQEFIAEEYLQDYLRIIDEYGYQIPEEEAH